MSPYSRTLPRGMALLAVFTAGAIACGDSASGPSETVVEVTVATTGSPVDPDGYSVSIDAGPPEHVDVNGAVTFESLASGGHTVLLSDVADNCTVGGDNPRTVTVEDGGTAETTFSVTCAPTPAEVVVVDGSHETGFQMETITLHLRNDGGPGVYRIEFWGLPTSPNGPETFMGESEPVEVDEDYDETVTFEIETNTFATHVLIFTRDANSAVYRDTDRFDFED